MVQPMWPSRSPTTTFCAGCRSRSEIERLGDAAGTLKPHQVQIGRLRAAARATNEPAGALGLVHAHSSPAGPELTQHRLRAALHMDRPRAGPRGTCVPAACEAARAHGRALDALHANPVAGAVGEAPGNVAIGTRHQERGTRERHAESGRGARESYEPRVVPGGGHALAEVHVVGDEGRAGGGQSRRRPPSCCCRHRGAAAAAAVPGGARRRALRRSSASGGGTGAGHDRGLRAEAGASQSVRAG